MDATQGLRPRTSVAIWVALAWIIVCDTATTVPAGPLSASGAATVTAGLLALFTLPWIVSARLGHPSGDSSTWEPFLAERAGHRWVPAALALFCVWIVGWLLARHTPEAIQNVSVYLAFPVVIAAVAASSSAGTAMRVIRQCVTVSIMFACVGLISILHPGGHAYGPRSFAIVALIMLAALIPHRPEHPALRFIPIVLVGLVALSLSRTATVIAVIMLAALILRGKPTGRGIRAVLAVAVACLGFLQLVTRDGSFRDRFLGGDAAVSAGGVKLNTSGRSEIWRATLGDAQKHRWVGNGPGSASDLLQSTFGNIAHPHNDYIRLFHDFGIIGIALFAIGYAALIGQTFRRARRLDHPIHWSAFLALTAVAAIAFTDNVLVYPFVMIPLGVLVGLSMAYELPAREPKQTGPPEPVYEPHVQRSLDAILARRGVPS